MHLSGYRSVWVVTLFDLPVKTRADKRRYVLFRRFLLEDGFRMMQYSVYMRHCSSEENGRVHTDRVRAAVPKRGHVRVMVITDKQFSRIKTFWGGKEAPTEKAPPQLLLF